MQYNRNDRAKELTECLLEVGREEEESGYEPARRLQHSRQGYNHGISQWGDHSESQTSVKRLPVQVVHDALPSRKHYSPKQKNLYLPSLERLTKKLNRKHSQEAQMEGVHKSTKVRSHSQMVAPDYIRQLSPIGKYHHEANIVSISLDVPPTQKIIKIQRINRHSPAAIPVHSSSPTEPSARRRRHSMSPEIRLTQKAEQVKLLNEQIVIYLNPIVARQMMEIKNPGSKFSSIRYAHQKNIRLGVSKIPRRPGC